MIAVIRIQAYYIIITVNTWIINQFSVNVYDEILLKLYALCYCILNDAFNVIDNTTGIQHLVSNDVTNITYSPKLFDFQFIAL